MLNGVRSPASSSAPSVGPSPVKATGTRAPFPLSAAAAATATKPLSRAMILVTVGLALTAMGGAVMLLRRGRKFDAPVRPWAAFGHVVEQVVTNPSLPDEPPTRLLGVSEAEVTQLQWRRQQPTSGDEPSRGEPILYEPAAFRALMQVETSEWSRRVIVVTHGTAWCHWSARDDAFLRTLFTALPDAVLNIVHLVHDPREAPTDTSIAATLAPYQRMGYRIRVVPVAVGDVAQVVRGWLDGSDAQDAWLQAAVSAVGSSPAMVLERLAQVTRVTLQLAYGGLVLAHDALLVRPPPPGQFIAQATAHAPRPWHLDPTSATMLQSTVTRLAPQSPLLSHVMAHAFTVWQQPAAGDYTDVYTDAALSAAWLALSSNADLNVALLPPDVTAPSSPSLYMVTPLAVSEATPGGIMAAPLWAASARRRHLVVRTVDPWSQPLPIAADSPIATLMHSADLLGDALSHHCTFSAPAAIVVHTAAPSTTAAGGAAGGAGGDAAALGARLQGHHGVFLRACPLLDGERTVLLDVAVTGGAALQVRSRVVADVAPWWGWDGRLCALAVRRCGLLGFACSSRATFVCRGRVGLREGTVDRWPVCSAFRSNSHTSHPLPWCSPPQ